LSGCVIKSSWCFASVGGLFLLSVFFGFCILFFGLSFFFRFGFGLFFRRFFL